MTLACVAAADELGDMSVHVGPLVSVEFERSDSAVNAWVAGDAIVDVSD